MKNKQCLTIYLDTLPHKSNEIQTLAQVDIQSQYEKTTPSQLAEIFKSFKKEL